MSAGSETSAPPRVELKPRAGLYERLFGADEWRALDEQVRRLHMYEGELHGEGTFAVRRGDRRAARLLARLLRMPEEGEEVAVRLIVTPRVGGGERWHRTFDAKALDTDQHAHAGHLLAESAGPFEVHFRLRAEQGALVYSQESTSLRLGPLRVPLPRRLAPRIEASERAAVDETRKGEACVLVSVSVAVPLVGHFISYEGRLRMEVSGG